MNASGSVIATLGYDGYGNLTTAEDTDSDRYRFTGRESDSESRLQYNRARYYDPKTGRWTSTDPIGFEAGDANLYRYVGNNATNATDPSGLFYPGIHQEITERSIRRWAQQRRIAPAVVDFVTREVVAANLDQDQGANSTLLHAHYNRPYERAEMFAERNRTEGLARIARGREWDQRYRDYLARLEREFSDWLTMASRLQPGAPGVITGNTLAGYGVAALRTLGRLTHAWQDFFAHAIREDQGGTTHRVVEGGIFGNPRAGFWGSEASSWPGFSAFTDARPVRGDPIDHRGLMPSSYQFGAQAEHPPLGEPLTHAGREYNERVAYAQAWTNGRVEGFLDEWIGVFGRAGL